MPETNNPDGFNWIDRRDREYIEGELPAEARGAAACAIAAYRRPDCLAVGDPVPGLALARLEGSGSVRLDQLGGRPVVLFFGSYT